jgi:7,8-dihydropterin-6-yl-methyl-4-(beta-D-ribofuranosyl)aminobenzene 5'-phosphate synthase
MKLTIVYDNEVFTKGIGLKSDWGFSCLIETSDTNILFDTGAKGKILLNNLEKLDINPKNIDKIIISHEHWDHNGGLTSLLPLIDNLEVYRINNENRGQGGVTVKLSEEPGLIDNNIYTTGRLSGSPVDEQSLVLKGRDGWYALVGCSHSGVENILQSAKQFGNVTGIIGGFHGFNNFSALDKLNLICPCHCTAHKKEIKKIYPDKSCDCGVGRIIDLDVKE